jgi:hypothetical protein
MVISLAPAGQQPSIQLKAAAAAEQGSQGPVKTVSQVTTPRETAAAAAKV